MRRLRFAVERALRWRGWVAAALMLTAIGGLAQRFGFERSDGPRMEFPAKAEFHFLRLEYTDLPQFHRRWGYSSRDGRGEGWWMMDWPDSEEHFTKGVERLTRMDAGEPHHMRLEDDRIFDHPWIYATQTGWWGLTDRETQRLREYLTRGGFLVVDDFWGPEQWAIFQQTMERVFPGQEITDIQESDAVMHVMYDIKDKDRTWIPGTRHLRMGAEGVVVQQPPGTAPAWRAMYDGKNRLVVAINFNTDVGDAWEFADSPQYPAEMTTLAYRYGINYLIYSLTH